MACFLSLPGFDLQDIPGEVLHSLAARAQSLLSTACGADMRCHMSLTRRSRDCNCILLCNTLHLVTKGIWIKIFNMTLVSLMVSNDYSKSMEGRGKNAPPLGVSCTTLWLHCGYIVATLWLHCGYIVTTLWLQLLPKLMWHERDSSSKWRIPAPLAPVKCSPYAFKSFYFCFQYNQNC